MRAILSCLSCTLFFCPDLYVTQVAVFLAHSDDGIESVENLEKTSRGIYLDVNQEALTASLVYEYLPLESVENWSISQGSNQVSHFCSFEPLIMWCCEKREGRYRM